MTDSKTATERLREMLDARGVEWAADDIGASMMTVWTVNGTFSEYLEGTLEGYVDEDGPKLKLKMIHVTPEQAIAATLVSGECEVVKEYVDIGGERMTDYTCCLNQPGWGHNFCPSCGKAVKR